MESVEDIYDNLNLFLSTFQAFRATYRIQECIHKVQTYYSDEECGNQGEENCSGGGGDGSSGGGSGAGSGNNSNQKKDPLQVAVSWDVDEVSRLQASAPPCPDGLAYLFRLLYEQTEYYNIQILYIENFPYSTLSLDGFLENTPVKHLVFYDAGNLLQVTGIQPGSPLTKSLTKLEFAYGNDLPALPMDVLNLSQLKELEMHHCCALHGLPRAMCTNASSLANLKTLSFRGCPEMYRFFEDPPQVDDSQHMSVAGNEWPGAVQSSLNDPLVLSSVESLYVNSMPILMIPQRPRLHEIFPNLKSIEIADEDYVEMTDMRILCPPSCEHQADHSMGMAISESARIGRSESSLREVTYRNCDYLREICIDRYYLENLTYLELDSMFAVGLVMRFITKIWNCESSISKDDDASERFVTTRLRSLKISDCDLTNKDCQKILTGLHNCNVSSLELLDLSGNLIDSFDAFFYDDTMPLQQNSGGFDHKEYHRPWGLFRTVVLHDNNILHSTKPEHREQLHRLLDRHPYMYFWEFLHPPGRTPRITEAHVMTRELLYKMILNWCGNGLRGGAGSNTSKSIIYSQNKRASSSTIKECIKNGDDDDIDVIYDTTLSATIPLSMWPMVLARVGRMNRDYIYDGLQYPSHDTTSKFSIPGKEMEASALYDLLHGPALLYRSDYRDYNKYHGSSSEAGTTSTIFPVGDNKDSRSNAKGARSNTGNSTIANIAMTINHTDCPSSNDEEELYSFKRKAENIST